MRYGRTFCPQTAFLGPGIDSLRCTPKGFTRPCETGIPTTRSSPIKASCLDQPPRPVQEYKPDSHRLRPHHKGLALGPTNLQKTNCTAETLGFRWTGFAPVFALLMPASSLVCSPPLLTLRLQPAINAPLPTRVNSDSHASVDGLSPRTLSAQNHIRPVSCYALFKWWLLLSQHPGCLRKFTSFYT